MSEEFLYYLWKYRLFNNSNLETVDGTAISLIYTGERNTDSGPDFINARIKIGNIEWAGDVEIHIKSSDWFLHNHQTEKAYHRIILHVVYENDTTITTNNTNVQTLELKGKFDNQPFLKYQDFKNSNRWIPCQNSIKEVNPLTFNLWLERLTIERLEAKTTDIHNLLLKTNNDWEEVFYISIARSFGLKINALAFEMLAKSTPLKYIEKANSTISQIEALMFGNAGILRNAPNDSYSSELRKEYNYLKEKFNLSPIDDSLWKFMRLRPSGFPTIRIAQFAQLMSINTRLFQKVIAYDKIESLQSLFSIATSDYWKSHYLFGKSAEFKEKYLGKLAIENIIINTVIPILFVYGKHKSDSGMVEKALKLLTLLPPEKNSIIEKWKQYGVKPINAGNTQALIQLQNNYCKQKNCLNCAVGVDILKLK